MAETGVGAGTREVQVDLPRAKRRLRVVVPVPVPMPVAVGAAASAAATLPRVVGWTGKPFRADPPIDANDEVLLVWAMAADASGDDPGEEVNDDDGDEDDAGNQEEDEAGGDEDAAHASRMDWTSPASQMQMTAATTKWTWHTAEPTTVSKSVFQGHAVRVTSAADARDALAELLLKPRIAKATHNMWAFRIRLPSSASGESSAFACEHDDDGEDAAGGRLAELLRLTHTENVMLVVSRWYGGVKLGPGRFKIIMNAGRDALALVADPASTASASSVSASSHVRRR